MLIGDNNNNEKTSVFKVIIWVTPSMTIKIPDVDCSKYLQRKLLNWLAS